MAPPPHTASFHYLLLKSNGIYPQCSVVTCVWFPQVRRSGLMATPEASSLLHRVCFSWPSVRLLWVGVTPLAAYHACLTFARGLSEITCLLFMHWVFSLLCPDFFSGLLHLGLHIFFLVFQCLFPFLWRKTGQRCLRFILCVVGCAGVQG